MAIGKKTPSATTATLEASPMPSQRISSGSSAILGIGNVAAMSGCTTASAREKNPTATPTLMPASAPIAKPQARRSRLRARCTKIWPETAMSQPSARTPSGSRAAAGRRCDRPPRSARPPSAALRHLVALEQRSLRLRLDQPPDAIAGLDEGGIALLVLATRAREPDRDGVEHLARPPREHDHAVGHEHGLLDIVRDVEDGLARAGPDGE